MSHGVDLTTLNALLSLFRKASTQASWRSALEVLMVELRSFFIFDNIAIYSSSEAESGALEVIYARALGRGKSAEADAAWGERVAGEVIANAQILLQIPPRSNLPNTGRLELPYTLGLPLLSGARVLGAMIFIRFGGPPFEADQIHLAALISAWASCLLERRSWEETYRQLNEVQYRIRLQDDFLATVSHELRTPLGFIKGYSTTLLRQDTKWDEATQREFLTVIDEETDRLAQLIDDLLESARLQSKTLNFKFQPMRVDALIRDAVIRFHQRHPEVVVRLDISPLPPILGDTIHLMRVLENLFSNAVKYAPGSDIEISVEQRGNMVHVRFSDHGPGIPPEHQAMIFERFYRVPGSHASSTGTGLGLYICKQIVTAHRGKMWVESEPGHGATFHIQLPLQPDEPREKGDALCPSVC